MNWLLPPLEPHFEAALRDVRARSVDSRVAAAERLSRPDAGREQEAEAGLLVLLKDTAPNVRAAALRGLAEVGTEAAHACVLGGLDDGDPLVRELAVVGVAGIAHPDRADALLEALRHPAPEVRFQALDACADLCPERATAPILALSRTDDARLREGAARALGHLDLEDGRITTRLHMLLDDSVENVRLEAALALAGEAPPGALSALMAALDRPDARMEALEALGNYRDQAARDAVYALGRRVLVSPLVNAACGQALLCMGDRNRGLECVRDALRALRGDGRDLGLEAVRAHRLVELGAELARLSRRRRGADPERIVRASAEIAKDSPPARDALTRMARSAGATGSLAASLLQAIKGGDSG